MPGISRSLCHKLVTSTLGPSPNLPSSLGNRNQSSQSWLGSRASGTLKTAGKVSMSILGWGGVEHSLKFKGLWDPSNYMRTVAIQKLIQDSDAEMPLPPPTTW